MAQATAGWCLFHRPVGADTLPTRSVCSPAGLGRSGVVEWSLYSEWAAALTWILGGLILLLHRCAGVARSKGVNKAQAPALVWASPPNRSVMMVFSGHLTNLKCHVSTGE